MFMMEEKKTLQERPAGLMEKPERISLLPGFGKGDAAAPGQHLHVVILNERQEAVNLVLTARHFNGQGVPRDVHDAGAQDLAEFNDFMPRSGIHADAGQYRFPVHVVRVAEIHYFHRVDEFSRCLMIWSRTSSFSRTTMVIREKRGSWLGATFNE